MKNKTRRNQISAGPMIGGNLTSGKATLLLSPMPVCDVAYCLIKILKVSTGVFAYERRWDERRFLFHGINKIHVDNMARMYDEAQVSTITDYFNCTFAYVSGLHDIPPDISDVYGLCSHARENRYPYLYHTDNQYAKLTGLTIASAKRIISYFLATQWHSGFAGFPNMTMRAWRLVRRVLFTHGWTIVMKNIDYRNNIISIMLHGGVDDFMFNELWSNSTNDIHARLSLMCRSGIVDLDESRQHDKYRRNITRK